MKKYIYMFSKKLLLLTIIPVLMLSSCSKDVLNETALDFLSTDNAYKTVSGIQQGISGLHTKVRTSFYSEAGGQQTIAVNLGGIGTDIAYHGEDPNCTVFLSNYATYLTPSSTFLSDLYGLRITSLFNG